MINRIIETVENISLFVLGTFFQLTERLYEITSLALESFFVCFASHKNVTFASEKTVFLIPTKEENNQDHEAQGLGRQVLLEWASQTGSRFIINGYIADLMGKPVPNPPDLSKLTDDQIQGCAKDAQDFLNMLKDPKEFDYKAFQATKRVAGGVLRR